jgi:iron complex outermembrane receptor protein
VDDNAFTAQPHTPLLPQISHDIELGAQWRDLQYQWNARFFQHQLSNEIYFDPLINHGLGANTNLDPTRRRGVALEFQWQLSKQWRFAALAQHVNAIFTEGDNEGKALALVPKNTASVNIHWLPGHGRKIYVNAQWVSAQRYGGDFTNTCATLIPSHATFDAHFSQAWGDWELAFSGTNLTNKNYFTNAFSCRSGIYPDDGRQVKVALQYQF